MIKIKKIIAMVCSLSMLFGMVCGVAAEDTNTSSGTKEKFQYRVIDDFEFKNSRGNWWIQNTGNATLSLSSQHFKSGTRALKYEYRYEKDEKGIISTNWSRGGTEVKNSGGYKYLGCWVYNAGENIQIAMELRDANNGTIRCDFKSLPEEGWQYLEWDIGDGFVHDMKIYQFIVKKSKDENGNVGSIYFDDLTLSKNSYYKTDGASFEMAGMAGVGDQSSFTEGSPTLSDLKIPAATRKSPQTMQLDNENEFKAIKYAKSPKELPNSISGLSIGDNGSALEIIKGSVGIQWAVPWLNDGEELYGIANQTTYSSGMHSSSDGTEWVMLTFPAEETIQSVKIYPRNASGLCYPASYTLEMSTDGESWTTVAEKKNYKYDLNNEPVVHEFDPIATKYLKLNATKLTHDGNPSTYYLQIREIEAYNTDGTNVGVRSYGTVASAGNPLTSGEELTYEDYFSNIFDLGVKWVQVSTTTFNKNGPSDTQVENMKYLYDNGVNIDYRFTKTMIDASESEARAYGEEYAETVAPYVEKMKDYIDVWTIANEDNFPGKPYGGQKTKAYAIAVGIVADKIRELDPGCKIEIETALIDFNWTKDVMEAGLAGKIDIMGIHVYKETNGVDNMIEANGTFIDGGIRKFADEHNYKDYRDEITEYKKLMEYYNPGSEVWCTETSVNRGNNWQCVSELVQAKWMAREYIYHQMLGVGPTCWWSLDGTKTGDIEWGLLNLNGNRIDIWYALRNVANTMNNDYTITDEITAEFSTDTEMIYECFKNGDTYQIPYWALAKMRTANTGTSSDVTISGVDVKNAVAIDMITGAVQELEWEQDGDKTVFKNMVVRDYPIVIRINSDAEYGVYDIEKIDEVPEKTLAEQIISGSTIIKVGASKGLVKDSVKEIKTEDKTGTVYIIDDMAYVPLRFLSEALGKKVYWLDGMIVISDKSWEIDNETQEQLKQYFDEQCKEAN